MEFLHFNAETYRLSALEALSAARVLYAAGILGKSLYLSGLAVECIFRAYRMRLDPAFSSRHDLYELHKISGFAELLPDVERKQISDALFTVRRAWKNAHRFASEAAMRKFLKDSQLDRRVKGDFLKENARRVYNAAETIIKIGDRLWNVSHKS